MESFNEMINKITEFLKTEAKTENVVGEPFQLGEFTCVPVINIGMGFGGGGGEGKGSTKNNQQGEGTGAGAGAGLGMGPVGFLVTKGEEISFIPTRTSKGLAAAFEKVPDLIEKYLEKKKTAEKV